MRNSKLKIDHTHQIPYVAAASQDGLICYIDERVPLVEEVDGRKLNICLLLEVHERTEQLAMNAGLRYTAAHKIAEYAENATVKALNFKPADYEKVYTPYIKRCRHCDTNKIPEDIERRPYEDSGETFLLEGKEKVRGLFPKTKKIKNRKKKD